MSRDGGPGGCGFSCWELPPGSLAYGSSLACILSSDKCPKVGGGRGRWAVGRITSLVRDWGGCFCYSLGMVPFWGTHVPTLQE